MRPARRELPRGRGPGWSAAPASLALALYGVGLALLVARARRQRARPRAPVGARHRRRLGLVRARRPRSPSAVGAGSALGGGWLGLLALGVLAGAVLALALRVAPPHARSCARCAPRAPRLQLLRRDRLAAPPALAHGSERRPAAPHARPRAAGRRVVHARHPSHPTLEGFLMSHRPGGCSPSLGASAVLAAAAVAVSASGGTKPPARPPPREHDVPRHPRARRRARRPEGPAHA